MLRLDNLAKHYGHVTALDGVSFDVKPGNLLGFLGPNGAGKTTAMRSIFGLVALDSGQVLFDGHQVGPEDRLAFGYMPEQRGLYTSMKVGEQLTYFGTLHGRTRAEAAASTGALLEEMGLADRTDSKVEQLSHGNQQRVQLAAALVHDPSVLVLDEPFSGLDPIGVTSMENILRERAGRGTAVMFSSHQLDLVEGLCDEVVIINNGKLALHGSMDELRERSDRRRLEVALGDAATDWTPGIAGVDVVKRSANRVFLSVPVNVDLSAILASACAAGSVGAFTFEPPTLSQMFKAAVGIEDSDANETEVAGDLAAGLE